MVDDDHTWTPDDYDKEIKRLEKERDELRKALMEPAEKKLRHERRGQLLGAWAIIRFTWNEKNLDELRETVRDDEQWLFDLQLLKLDGWWQDKDGGWKAPGSG